MLAELPVVLRYRGPSRGRGAGSGAGRVRRSPSFAAVKSEKLPRFTRQALGTSTLTNMACANAKWPFHHGQLPSQFVARFLPSETSQSRGESFMAPRKIVAVAAVLA